MPGKEPELRLYNTLTRSKELFRPIDRNNVRVYVCGPTVYDFAHIGNARPVIVFDVLFRLLRHLYGPEHVTYVRNITDVDDKINARAAKRFGKDVKAGRLTVNEAIRRVTEETAGQFHEDVAALGCLEPTHEPRATEFVLPREDGRVDMVTLIQSLFDRGHAYVAAGGEGREVLFDVGSMPAYGSLSRRKLEDQQAGARVAVEAHKKNPADFVLWKESGDDEPGWEASFAVDGRTETIRGRPGWHIECSAMSAAYLGDIFDIHGGGLDLIFPHHENEIAQSCCAHDTERMANVWMHNGFVQVEGRKMAKSEGNFVTIHDLLSEWAGPVMRLVMLQTHYRQPIDWTERKLVSAREELAEWASLVFDPELIGRFQADSLAGNRQPIDRRALDPLLDDLNTVDAITGIRTLAAERNEYELLKAVEFLGLIPLPKVGALQFNHFSGTAHAADFAKHAETIVLAQAASANTNKKVIEEINRKLATEGLVINVHENDGSVTLDVCGSNDGEDEVQIRIDRRLALIREKNWAEADRIRDELLEQGIQLKDSKDPETGERITTWEVKR